MVPLWFKGINGGRFELDTGQAISFVEPADQGPGESDVVGVAAGSGASGDGGADYTDDG